MADAVINDRRGLRQRRQDFRQIKIQRQQSRIEREYHPAFARKARRDGRPPKRIAGIVLGKGLFGDALRREVNDDE